MAYNTKYQLHYKTPMTEGWVYLKKKDYSGAVTTLKLIQEGLKLEYKLTDWFKPIVGNSISLDIVNETNDFWTYSDLFGANEKEWRIRYTVKRNNQLEIPFTLFEGWMDSEVTQVQYTNSNSVISISGSSYLSHINNLTPDIVQNGDIESIYNILNGCLKMTEYPDTSGFKDIWLNMYLEPSGNWYNSNNNSALNTCGLEVQAFAEDNQKYKGATDIIESILTPFNAYLYQWKDKWYIERYSNMISYDGNKLYKVYDGDSSYGYLDYCSSTMVQEPSLNLCDLGVVAFPNLTIDPGLKTLKIKKEINEYANHTSTNFSLGKYGTDWISYSNVVTILKPQRLCKASSAALVDVFPPLKGWNYYVDPSGGQFIDHFTYQTGLSGWFGDRRGSDVSYKSIGNPIFRNFIPNTITPRWLLASRFKFTSSNKIIDASAYTVADGTTLNINFKYAPHSFMTPSSAAYADWDMNYVFKWHMRNTQKLNYGIGTQYYIREVEPVDDDPYWEQKFLGSIGSTIEGMTNETIISASNLDDFGILDVNISIPVADVSGLTHGNQQWIFYLDMDYISNQEDDNSVKVPVFSAYYGDFVITVDSDYDDNVLVGEINQDVLKEKEITLNVSDINTWNSPSGIRYSTDYNETSSTWRETTQTGSPSAEHYSLAEWLLKDRFKLFGENRKKLQLTAKYGDVIKPFTFVYDTEDPNNTKYVVTNYTYSPTIDKYNLTLWEYSDDQIILE